MDKNAIRKYAVWARRELISRVSQRAALYEITADGYGDQNASSVRGRLMSAEEKKQRTALIAQIKEKGYEQVMEEIAYTWFNRFSALRFMEVNGYLPTRIRVFTNDDNAFKPQILDEAINMVMDGLDMQKVYDLKNANDDDALFKYMIITQCNALSSILPGMFQRISDYTELLFPDNLLRKGSVVEQMIAMIPQEDWTDQVQIIGWLYQFYIAEPKDELINAHKKYKKEEVPFVTQLFTPDWIVRYMVENSLGRLWLKGHPNDELRSKWIYYLDGKELDTKEQFNSGKDANAVLKPEDILTIDPCHGSGHVLAYMFDVLVQIYEAYGYSAREAVSSIVKNNIWGLDIDERATQLAYFSVMMKARQYDRRFFSRGIQPHVYVITESNNFDQYCIDYFVNGRSELKSAINVLVNELKDAKEYGSILNVTNVNFEELFDRFDEIRNENVNSIYGYQALKELLPFVKVAKAMAQKYHIVVTNPPYMNASYMPAGLKNYVQKQYSDYKGDLFAVFSKRVMDMCVNGGEIGLLMPYVWMFIASYEKMRCWINDNAFITSLVQLEYNAFEAACVPVATFTMQKGGVKGTGEYVKLSDFRGADNQAPRLLDAIADQNCGYRFEASQSGFKKLPGNLIAYWASPRIIDTFSNDRLASVLTTREGMATAGNDQFLRLWYEVENEHVGWNIPDSEAAIQSRKKWFPYNKGGDYRKWYGNNDYLVNWENDGTEIRNNKDEKTGRIRSHNYNGVFAFREGITWSALSSSNISVRYAEQGFLFDSKGAKGFANNENDLLYALALINSKVGYEYLSFISPTIDFKVGDVIQIPLIKNRVDEIVSLVKECISISKAEWDSYETSWDFKRHPLIRGNRIKDAFDLWSSECNSRIERLCECETKINEILISSYGLQNEVSAEVNRSDIALKSGNLERDIRSLISYAVGCMFGRYSLDKERVLCSSKELNLNNYNTYHPDLDNVIPISNDEYFEDDIVGRFVDFIEKAYSKECLEDNLRFVADALGGNGTPREVIRNYFLNGFYADHCSTYAVTGSGKRPIYWLFDSGKANGFKCLIYMHRYQRDTIARIRTDYVHEQQSRYRTAIEDLNSRIANAGTGDRVKLTKQLNALQSQADEVRIYEEKIHHLADQMIQIDLDDGVKFNYAKFQDVLAKIK